MSIHSLLHNLNPDYILHPGQVDLWRINLSSPIAEAYEYLNTDEQQRADRFQFAHHQRRFAHARAALKQILARYLASTTEALHIKTHAYGKPYINNKPQLEFNLSHTHDHALLAIGQNHALGVDIEIMSQRPYHGIAANLFSKNEQEALLSCTSRALAFKFFTLWTQKEAFIKACGLGLRYPTQAFSVMPKAAHQSLVYDSQQLKHWQMLTFMHTVGIPAALCCDLKIETIRFYNFNPLDKNHAK